MYQPNKGYNRIYRVIDPNIYEDNELNCPQLMSHSSYYDYGKLSTALQACKNMFTICSTNIEFINVNNDNLG